MNVTTPSIQTKILAALVCSTGLLMVPTAKSQSPAKRAPEVKPLEGESIVLMQAKLSSSKRVLEGLLRRDFDRIATAAREMKRISKATEWPRQRDEVYEHFSTEFQRQCNQLEAQANELNHSGVKFTYLQMTSTCINCHEYIRDSRRMAGQDHQAVRPIPSQWGDRNKVIR